MKYVVSIAIEGRLNVAVEASSDDEAEELALERFRDENFNDMDVVAHHIGGVKRD